ncbi:putative uncharacterized protein encoded by LINC00032 [Symphalangus syndactylus]|uniref:putative uncharacterized protein encoded by LINC00032 n=1 Tax=Symphalangus syndactylus TaxID=9590 RepID=UPI0030064242
MSSLSDPKERIFTHNGPSSGCSSFKRKPGCKTNQIFHSCQKPKDIFNKMAHQKRPSVTSEFSSKVPDEVRQRSVKLFVEKYLKVCKTEDEAVYKSQVA